MTASSSEQDEVWQARLAYELKLWQALDERHRLEQSHTYLHEINQVERDRLTDRQASERKALRQQLRAERIAWWKTQSP